MIITAVVAWLLAVAALLTWLARTWSARSLAARSRATLVRAGVDIVVAMALVRALAPPPGPWSWLWLLAAGVIGVGLAGAIRRWPTLPWRVPPLVRPGPGDSEPGPTGSASSIAATTGYVLVGAVLVAVLA